MSNTLFVVAALYKFASFPNFKSYRDEIKTTLTKHQVKGTLLIAHEGINGTVAGSQKGIEAVLSYLQNISELGDISYKLSYTNEMPFYRTKVKLKKEIVTMGVEDIDPKTCVGEYVKPKDWDALIEDPDVLLVDTRNNYEVQIGTFKNAINPNTETFREFPDYVKKSLDKNKHKKIAMFCTGGIRCEKSTAYLKQQGFDKVYHLEGGILKYLEEVPETESSWEGECFVFDNRVAVNHQLNKGKYDQCYACRMPITEAEKQSKQYIKGESCPYCFEQISAKQKERFSQREKQMQLAKQRGGSHIGGEVVQEIDQRRVTKKAQKQAQILNSKNINNQ